MDNRSFSKHILEASAFPVCMFLIARVALSLVAAVSIATSPTVPIAAGNFVFQSPMDQGISHYFLEPWNRWDTQWYLKIAAQGYATDDGSLGFYPLYPLLVRVVGILLGGQWLLAALVVSNLAALGCYVILYQMVQREFGEETARKTLLWLAVFPTGFFLFAGYTESLFLLSVLLALQSARDGHWARAGLANGMAMLTRAPGVLLILPLLVEFALQYRRGQVRWNSLFALGVVSSIGTMFWIYLYTIFGDANVWARGFSYWRVTGLPGQNIVMAIQMLFSDSRIVVTSNAIDLGFTLLFLVLIGAGMRRMPLVWTICAIAVAIPSLLAVQILVPEVPLTSMPRYGLVAFPVFVTLALTRWRLGVIPIVLSLIVQATFVFSFARWGWVG
jgi:Gpi18-like mannosyltransferase